MEGRSAFRSVARTFVLLFGALTLVTALTRTAVADRVPVRAGVHKEFGRLVFDWPRKVGYSAVIKDRLLTIRFDRTIDPDFGNVVPDINPYVGTVDLAADKRTVLVRLNDSFGLRTMTIDNHVVIDLLKSGAPVKPDTSENDGRAPEKRGPDDLSENGGATAAAPSNPALEKSPAGRVLAVRTGHHKNYGRLVFGWPEKVGFSVKRQGRNVSIIFAAPADLDIAKLRRELPPQIIAAARHPSNSGLELGLIVAPDSQLRYFHNGTDVVFDVVSKRVKTAAKAEIKPTVPKPARKKNRDSKARPVSHPLVTVDAVQSGAELVVTFNWRRPVAASVFRRNASLWVHFDQPARLDMGPIQAVGKGRFRDAEQENHERSVHVRLPVPNNNNVMVRRSGTVWVLEIGPGPKRAIQNFPMEVQNKAGHGAQLLIKAEKPGAVSAIRDEIIGDTLYTVPVYRTGRGTRLLRRFPDFELLASPQGVTVRLLNDSVALEATRDGIVVTKPGGLTISPEAVSATGRTPYARDAKLLDLKKWRLGPVDDYKKIELDLFQYVVQPSVLKRDSSRLELAKFYASHGMGAEALGVLDTLLTDTPQILRDPGIRALRGLANYLVGHYAEADADLSHPSLAGRRELYPWRAGIAAARGDWTGAYRLFADTDIVIGALPSEFAVKLGLLAAEAALSVEEKEVAEARLGALELLPAANGQLDQLAYLRGHLLKLKGNTAKALAAWEAVAANGVRPSRAKASFARINTLVESGAIKVPEAIDELQNLQFAWRNSVFEFDLLNKLGELHARQRNLRSALVTLREAVTLFKDIKGAQSLTQRMRDMFRKFYLEGEADHLQPVVALGLYNEFRELTPTGPDGDKMIRLLSERLIKVDLLEDAAKLLDHQIRFRLTGPERARTGARLAEILLLDGKPAEALAALSVSEHPGALPALLERRRGLHAAALMDSRRYDEALDNIAEDFTREFDMLRAQIYWRAADWEKASRVLARLTGAIDAESLDDRDAELLLRRAVALGLASDFSGMQFLRERFGAAMEKSGQAASFKAVAGGKLLQPKDFAALARRAAELDSFRAFMETLNKRSGNAGSDQETAIN